ncbi:NAD-dependent epimerase/dehydratase family protein [Liquorilactobacillus sucicola]|uniref:NAD-dependent epimerase/dehydratase family protein n=1 Tax=Liquorilactobacillus sucicola TaxID=519050 RepID=UPI00070506CE|nr:NAD-dependent epimerase/dehydratase family protein [Liquorilactobacillus sucicola]
MVNYLITGGAGFIGSNLAAEVVKRGGKVSLVDDLSMGKEENIIHLNKKRVTFYKKSITDHDFMTNLLIKEHFDYIILLGAVASVANSVRMPYETHEVNQEANINILETIRKFGLNVKKLLFASSAAVYGNNPQQPKKEGSAIEPGTPYAIDKFASERYALTYGELYQIPTVATRFFNVYGPRQNPDSPYSGVLSIIFDCLENNKQFKLFGDGSQTRDFTYVKDVVNAVLLLLYDSKAVNSVYNVATGKSVSLKEVIATFEKILNKQLEIEYLPERIGDVKHSSANISRLMAMGFRPDYDIVAGLNLYINAGVAGI